MQTNNEGHKNVPFQEKHTTENIDLCLSSEVTQSIKKIYNMNQKVKLKKMETRIQTGSADIDTYCTTLN